MKPPKAPRQLPAAQKSGVARTWRQFNGEEDGSILIFSLFMFVLMLMVAGISLDIERFETARTKLQATADGAALTGASLNQDYYPLEDVVLDYFAKSGMGSFIDVEDIDIVSYTNYRHVEVNTEINVPTHFFNMIGIENLATTITSVAAESIGNVEISLVLDVSGSMRHNSKLPNLKDAAEDFIDSIYAGSSPGSVSTSIVPYSTQVAAGPDILDHFTDRQESHEISHCLNFAESDYDTVALDLDGEVDQTLHFDPWTNEHSSWDANDNLYSIVCPTQDWREILLFSENTTQLKNYVNAFQATNWTSIEIGVKWGAALLDPSMAPVVQAQITAGDVSADFHDRPRGFDEADGLKVMVVMTDGENTEQYEMADPYRSGSSFVYVYYDAYDRPYYSIWKKEGVTPNPDVEMETHTTSTWQCNNWYYYYGWRCSSWTEHTETTEVPAENWYLANDYSHDGVSDGWRATPYGETDAVPITWNDLWAEVPVEVFTDRYLKNMGYSSTVRNAIEDARIYIDGDEKDDRTLAICNAAKAKGVLIYTIGFEAPYNSEVLLETCATTPSHYFDVDGAQISQAFSAIAADINRLRLIQ